MLVPLLFEFQNFKGIWVPEFQLVDSVQSLFSWFCFLLLASEFGPLVLAATSVLPAASMTIGNLLRLIEPSHWPPATARRPKQTTETRPTRATPLAPEWHSLAQIKEPFFFALVLSIFWSWFCFLQIILILHISLNFVIGLQIYKNSILRQSCVLSRLKKH